MPQNLLVPKKEYRFQARLKFNGCWEHHVWVNGSIQVAIVGDDSYLGKRFMFSGLNDVEFARDIIGRVGTITLESNAVPSDEMVAAFNEWRMTCHAERVNRLKSQPDRYGVIEDDDPTIAPFPVVVPAVYEAGEGWVRIDQRRYQ
ncbi:hypothetical protein [Pseudomonas sp. LS-2]|uniref:hypothetical protein n=1 Tax=Pseudomonas sp. LS-2 TaxID=2315859 RepID=UPI000E70CE3B|nr:hypothetical protein [Pseudomonas sp. LS-2]RJX72648.1 hypothetical protein D3M70_31090 [Pseudomonas sp. LS-2]